MYICIKQLINLKTTRRQQLLRKALNENEGINLVLENSLKADNKFLKRAIRDLKDKIEDLEEGLENRLSQETPIDKSVIENTYASILSTKELLGIYEDFQKTYFSEKGV